MKRQTMAFLGVCLVFTAFTANRAQSAGDLKAAEAKAPLCMGCHGAKGEGKDAAEGQPAYPTLAGQREAYFVKSVNAYKNDERKDPIMGAIAKALSDEDIVNLASYYAAFRK